MRPPARRLLCCLVLAAGLVTSSASAQHFGKNKVRYRDFEFRVLETPHFDVYYYPVEQEAARQAGVLAERWYTTLARALGHQLTRRQPLVLYATPSDFTQTNVIPGFLGEGTGGVTEGRRNRIVLPFGLGLAETSHVIGHELVHAFQYDLAKNGHSSILMMPLWFIEGMAEYLTLGPGDNQTRMWMRDVASRERIPTLRDLSQPKYFPYRYGHGVWTFLTRRYGEDVVPRLLKSRAHSLEGRFKAVTGRTLKQLSEDWHQALRSEFPAGTRASSPQPLLARRNTGARLHTGPSLSPDGRHLAFISEKDQFSIEIFLADAATGAVRRKLLDRTTNPHFDGIEFLDTAGAWDPSSRRLAFAATRRGAAVLVILDTTTGRTEREVRFDEPGQICNPAWSPDGRHIAFAGLSGGWSDLYTYDLVTGELRQRTRDAFADLQPAWSPDSASLVFSTDRFSTDLPGLRVGSYRLATLDLGSGELSEVPGTIGGRNFNPQFGRDGGHLFFVGDPDGQPAIYQLAIASNQVTRMTGEEVAVAGITALSPAISFARSTGTLAYSAFKRGGYEIVTVKPDQAFKPVAAVTAPPIVVPPELQPAGEAPGTIGGSQPGAADDGRDASPVAASRTADAFGVRPYRRKLSLEALGQPYLSAGGGAFGTFLRAGMGFSFGDMLGDQQLAIAAQVGRRSYDFAGRAFYINRRSRWNWGAAVEYMPMVFGRSQRELSPGAETMDRVLEYRRQNHFGVSGLAIYPFNRSHRLEFTGGVRQVSFGRQIQRTTVAVPSGRELASETEQLPDGAPIRLFDASAALVYDSSIFGATSPILGRRYRFEISPSVGSLSYTTLLADFRQYLMPLRPFTLALRGRVVGRFGGGATDTRVLPLVLSLRDQVRGYDINNLSARACGTTGAGCSLLDMLSGSRLAVANVELRFPIPGVLSRTFNYGPLPLEGFVFADAASVRTRAGGLLDGWRDHLLRSVGTGVRMNAAGVIFEVAAARTFDRPGRGWAVAFNLKPGF